MKKVLKILLWVVAIVYASVAIFLTVCLLNLNKYNLTEFDKSTFIVMEDDSLEPNFKEGSLVVVDKPKLSNIKAGDKIFFYNTYAHEIEISFASVTSVEQIDDEQVTYVLEGDKPISSDYVIGREKDSKEYESVGGIMNALQSRWGFLLGIVLPILFAFVYEIYAIVIEVKKTKKSNK